MHPRWARVNSGQGCDIQERAAVQCQGQPHNQPAPPSCATDISAAGAHRVRYSSSHSMWEPENESNASVITVSLKRI